MTTDVTYKRGLSDLPDSDARFAGGYDQSWALVIGIDYNGTGNQRIRRLSNAEADARAVAQALHNLNFPPANVRALIGSDATRTDISEALHDWLADSDRIG